MKVFGENPTVDFDYFHFEGYGYNYAIAKELAIILMDESNIDELKGSYNEDTLWNSSIGTGGSGGNYRCPSQSAQRASLASHFSSYALRRYQSCYLTLYEYECLRIILIELEDNYYEGSHREKIHGDTILLIKTVCSEFEKAYAMKNPAFLFTMLKR